MEASEIRIKRIDNGFLVNTEYPLDADKDDTERFYKTESKALAVVAQIMGITDEAEEDDE